MSSLRESFPALERAAYLNAGSVGPVPTAAVAAAEHAMRDALTHGRATKSAFELAFAQAENLRDAVATIMGAAPEQLALTTSTTGGLNAVIAGLDLQPGDEVLTTDQEHPGLLAPLAVARQRHGVEIRTAPFAEIASAVGAQTKLVAASHVSWQTGEILDVAALAEAGALVLLDGAQGLGAVPTDVGAIGCDFYAAPGQKWLCGPIGTGYLWVHPERLDLLSPTTSGYHAITDGERALELPFQEGARRLDSGMLGPAESAWALAAIGVLAGQGYAAVLERGIELAGELAAALGDRGREVAPRGASTLVSWTAGDPAAEAARLQADGFVVRDLPGTPYVRASVGAWNEPGELERLAVSASASS